MKKLFFLLTLQSIMSIFLQGQAVSNYSCRLDNGIVVKNENCWNHVNVNIRYDTAGYNDKIKVLSVNIKAIGDLISGSAYKVYSSGKEVKEQSLQPGTYVLKVSLRLSGKPGIINFDIGNVAVKQKTRTIVSSVIYDYQILIEEVAGTQNGLSYYQSKIYRYKGNDQQNLNWGYPSFYAKGKHEKAIPPDEPMGDYYGRIKSGTYDVLISINISGQSQKVWLENFMMKPDISYKIYVNLNGGEITYTGGIYEVKAIHLYPAGTAEKQKGNPSRINNLEVIGYEPATNIFACPPGTYDILLNFGPGAKYDWRKNVVIKTGSKTEIK